MKILLDYVFPISIIQPTPAASTAFLKQVCVVAKPKAGQEGNVGELFLCTSMTQVAERTDNTNAQHLFNAGMTKVFILLANDLDLTVPLTVNAGEFFTLLISSDFVDTDIAQVVTTPEVKASRKIQDILYTSKLDGTDGNAITIEYADTNTGGAATASVIGNAITVSIEAGVTTAGAILAAIQGFPAANALVSGVIDTGDSENDQDATVGPEAFTGGVDEVLSPGDGLILGPYKGVVGIATESTEVAEDQAKIENRCAFKIAVHAAPNNMFAAFGKLLSNQSNWLNNQYVTMPTNDGVSTLGDANYLFDERVSFVINDEEFGNRLALFAAGGKAIIAPYIIKNLMINIQSRTLQWISMNQPQYTLRDAALLETRLNEDVIQNFIDRQWIESGNVEITLREQNFVANGEINVPEPKALWRVFGELTQTI